MFIPGMGLAKGGDAADSGYLIIYQPDFFATSNPATETQQLAFSEHQRINPREFIHLRLRKTF